MNTIDPDHLPEIDKVNQIRAAAPLAGCDTHLRRIIRHAVTRGIPGLSGNCCEYRENYVSLKRGVKCRVCGTVWNQRPTRTL